MGFDPTTQKCSYTQESAWYLRFLAITGKAWGHWCRHLLEPPTQPPTLSDVATKAGYLSQLPSSCQKQMKLLISIGAMKKCGHLADQYSKCSLHSVQACTLLFGQGHWEVHVWKMRATGNKSKSSHCANAQEERGFTNQSAHVYGTTGLSMQSHRKTAPESQTTFWAEPNTPTSLF